MDLAARMSSLQPISVAANLEVVGDPDYELLVRYRDHGDRAALEQLLERHAEVAYRVAVRMAGNEADAEDVLQEGFIACMASAKSYRGSGSVRSWIIAIVANAQRRQSRSQRRRRRYEASAPVPRAPEPTNDERLGALALRCLADLPERYRVPVTMRHVDQLAFADIASALGAKEKSVRTRVGRGMERLRAALGRRDVALSAVVVAGLLSEVTAAAPPHLAGVVGSAITKGLSLSPKALSAAAVSVGGVTGGLTLTAKVALTLLALAVGGGAFVGWELRPIRFGLAVEDPVVAVELTRVEQALAQRLSLDIDDRLQPALERIRRALPNELRVRFTCPLGLLDQNQVGGPLVTAEHLLEKKAVESIQIRLVQNNATLQEVLDAVCAQAALRWTASSAGIVIDRPLVEAERTQREAAFAEHPTDATAAALSEGLDVQAWRPLLLALGEKDNQVAVASLSVFLKSITAPKSRSETYTSPVIAYSDDQAVCAAVERAIAAAREPQTELIKLAGHLQIRSIVPACLALVEAGRSRQTIMEELFRDHRRQIYGAAACYALGRIGDSRALPVLLAELDSSKNRLQSDQIAALGCLGDRGAVEPLIAVARDQDTWAGTREVAVMALAEIGDRAAVPALAAIVMDNTDDASFVRIPAVAALGWLGGADAEVALREQAGLGEQSDTWVCGAAIHELAYLPGPESDAVLLHMLNDYFNGDTAATVLASRRSPELVSALTERLHHAARRNNGDTYSHIARALAQNADPLAQQALIAATAEASERHAWEHARALAACAEPAAEQALMAMVAAGQPVKIRRAAANALGGSGPAAQALAVRLVTEDPDLEVRTQAMSGFNYTLRSIGRHPLDQAIWQEWLCSTEPMVRATAIRLIAGSAHFGRSDRFDSAFTITAVAAALADVSSEVRRSLVRSGDARLFHSLDPSLWEPYVALLTTDSDAQVRETVAANVFRLTFPSWTISNDELATLMNHLLSASTVDVDPRVRAQAGVTVMQIIRGLREDTVHRGIAIDVVEEKIRAHHASEADARVRLLMTRVLDPQQSYLDINLDEFGKFDPTESNPGAMPSVNEDF